jgi:DHA2 family multidrug resistance protein
MGIFMAGISVGPAIGPSIGGYLVEHLNWRMIFYMNLPMGVYFARSGGVDFAEE